MQIQSTAQPNIMNQSNALLPYWDGKTVVSYDHMTVDDTNWPGRTVLLRSSEESMAGISMYGAVLARSKYPTWLVFSTTPFHMLETFRWSSGGTLLQHVPNTNCDAKFTHSDKSLTSSIFLWCDSNSGKCPYWSYRDKCRWHKQPELVQNM